MGRQMSTISTANNKNISIVRVVYEFYPSEGGAATHIRELSKKIDPYLKSQFIIAPKHDIDCTKFDDCFGVSIIRVKYFHFRRRIVKIPVAPLDRLSYSVGVYSKLKNMERPDIIHAHGISNTAYCTLIGKILRVPVVGMVHGSTNAYSQQSGLYESILARLLKPDFALVLDDGSMAPVKFKKIWKDKMLVVYHGIDTEAFKSISDKKKLFKDLGLEGSNFIILSTSSLIPVKNVDLLIESFKLLIDRYKINAHLLIAGHGSLKDSLLHLTETLRIERNVTFLGNLRKDEIIKYLSVSNIVAATSLYSNMNRSVQEAMACERPVVVFNSGRTGELIRHMENGVLIAPGDIESFAENLYLLYRNEKLSEKLGKNARNTILTERNWQKRILQELEVYNKLLK